MTSSRHHQVVDLRLLLYLHEPNIYLNISYDDGNHRCVRDCDWGLDIFGEPLDEEEYKHENKTLVDTLYRLCWSNCFIIETPKAGGP